MKPPFRILLAVLLLTGCRAPAPQTQATGLTLHSAPGGGAGGAAAPATSNLQPATLRLRLGSINDVGYSECGNLPATGAVLISADRPGMIESSADLVTWKDFMPYQYGTVVYPIRTSTQYFRLKTN